MRTLLLAAAAATTVAAAGAAQADGHTLGADYDQLCFDKGTLRYVACPDDAPLDPLEAYGPVGPVYSFTGIRLGANVGYIFGDADATTTTLAGAVVGTDTVDIDGASVGLSLGYDYQFGMLVAGVEADAELASLNGKSALPVAAGADVDSSWLASIRARLGVVLGERTLTYLTGGWEMQELDIALTGTAVEQSETISGYTVGAGVEHMINSDVSLRLEYRYTDYDAANASFGANNRVVDLDAETHAIRVGLGYRF